MTQNVLRRGVWDDVWYEMIERLEKRPGQELVAITCMSKIYAIMRLLKERPGQELVAIYIYRCLND